MALFYTHSMFLDYKLGKYGHGVDDISFIFGFVLCGMSIFVTIRSLDGLCALLLRLRYMYIDIRKINIHVYAKHNWLLIFAV